MFCEDHFGIGPATEHAPCHSGQRHGEPQHAPVQRQPTSLVATLWFCAECQKTIRAFSRQSSHDDLSAPVSCPHCDRPTTVLSGHAGLATTHQGVTPRHTHPTSKGRAALEIKCVSPLAA